MAEKAHLVIGSVCLHALTRMNLDEYKFSPSLHTQFLFESEN